MIISSWLESLISILGECAAAEATLNHLDIADKNDCKNQLYQIRMKLAGVKNYIPSNHPEISQLINSTLIDTLQLQHELGKRSPQAPTIEKFKSKTGELRDLCFQLLQ